MLAAGLASASCGDVARQGRSPEMLIVDSMEAASGAEPGATGVPLLSDVVTIVTRSIGGVDTPVPTIFNDIGSATLRTVLKNQGSAVAVTNPSLLNAVNVTRYHVEYIRADGRNTQGVDVPYAFDGATTVTVTNQPAAVSFEIVRHNAKEEAPLKALASGHAAIFISTIAHVTFYGRDLAGNDVQGSGDISVNFGDFADP
jgi:hypothetical protein